MSNWRPEGWNNPHITKVSYKDSLEERIFEAGADAMLGAICEEIKKVENRQPYDSPYREIQCEYIAFEVCRQKILCLFK